MASRFPSALTGAVARTLLAGALIATISRTGAAQAAAESRPLHYHGISVGAPFKDLRKQFDRIASDLVRQCDFRGTDRDRDCRDLIVRLKPDKTEARIPVLTMDADFRVVFLELRVDAPADVTREQVLDAFVGAWGVPNDSATIAPDDPTGATLVGRWARDGSRATVTLFPASQTRTPELGIQLRLDRTTGRPAFAP